MLCFTVFYSDGECGSRLLGNKNICQAYRRMIEVGSYKDK